MMGVSLGLAWPIGLAYALVWLGVFGADPDILAGRDGRGDFRAAGGARRSGATELVAGARRAGAAGVWSCTARTSRGCARGPSRRSKRSRERASRRLAQDEAFARIRLLRSPNIGPICYRQLHRPVRRCRPRRWRRCPISRAAGGGAYRLAPADRGRAARSTRCASSARAICSSIRPTIRALLAELETAPPILTVRGDPALLALPGDRGGRRAQCLGRRRSSWRAISRWRWPRRAMSWSPAWRAGSTGRRITARWLPRAGERAHHRRDRQRHRHRLSARTRRACRNASPARRCCSPNSRPGVEPLARHFPSRNRIIAGLAAGTLVVEAAPKSGSLITARLAGEAGREVMAIPGSPLDSRSAGCNQLIRDGAVLVQSPDEVIELVEGFAGQPRSRFRDTTAAHIRTRTRPRWPMRRPISARCSASPRSGSTN